MNTIKLVGTLTSLLVLAACNGENEDADAYGNFEAKEIIIAAEVNGKILELSIEEGQELNQAEKIGLIDTVQLSLSLKGLFSKKKAVRAKLTGVEAQIDVLKEQKGNLLKEQDRVKKLIEDNAATTKQLDDITYKINVIEKQIYSVRTQKNVIHAELEAMDSQVKALKDQLSRCSIVNPVKGSVLEKYVEEYEFVHMGKSIYKIADLSEMELKVYITGSQLPHVKIGQQVKVFIDKNKNENTELEGIVSWISSKAEFTPKIIQTKEERVNLVYAMKVMVKNDGRIKIGMPGEIFFN